MAQQPNRPPDAFPSADPATTPPADDRTSLPSAAVDADLAQEAEGAAGDAGPTPEPTPGRVAVVFPHPDDAEFVCAGTVARWAAQGAEVTYVLLTSGDKGSDDPAMTPEQLVATREAEQRAACAILGAGEPLFLRHADATLVADLALRRELVAVLRRLRPDAVVCYDPTMRWSGQNYVNHPDHIASGEATLAAVYPAARDRMTFPELLAEGLEPHKVREVYLAGARDPDIWIDTTPYLETKLAALRAHASQLADWDPEEMIRRWAREEGERNPAPDKGEYAESFKYIKLD